MRTDGLHRLLNGIKMRIWSTAPDQWLRPETNQENASNEAGSNSGIVGVSTHERGEPGEPKAGRTARSPDIATQHAGTAAVRTNGQASATCAAVAENAQSGGLMDFRAFVQNEARRLLDESFPGQNLDPDQIYVNQRDSVTRLVTTSRTLTDELLVAIKDGAPSYDPNHAGLFRLPEWSDAERIPRMDKQRPSNALIDIVTQVTGRLLSDRSGEPLDARYRNHLRERIEQQWYPHARAEDLQSLRQLDALCNSDEEAVDRLMKDLSLQDYAKQRIQAYMREHGGETVDADTVMIRVETQVDGRTLTTEQSLTEVALQGPYADGTRFTLAASSEQPTGKVARSTPAILKQMLGELDIRSHYVDVLRQRHDTASVRHAMNDALASRAQRAAYHAKLKGEITQDDYDLIQRVCQAPGVVRSDWKDELGGITMFGGGQLKDIQVYRETDPKDRTSRYVMYAPGAPEKEFHAANTEYQLSQQVGEWTKTEAGRRYLTDQLDPGNRDNGAAFFEKVFRKPTKWNATPGAGASASWKAFEGDGYRAQLGEVVAQKCRTGLLEAERALAPSWYARASADDRKNLNSLIVAARAAQQAYQAVPQPESFQAFAHREVEAWLSQRLCEQGVTESIDPDTVKVDLAGDGMTVMTLTELVTFGYRAHRVNLPRTMRFSSTIGQDLSGLESDALRGYIGAKPRSAYIGTRYIDQVKADYLSEGPSLDERRDRYFDMATTAMSRDALLSWLKNEIDESQYLAVRREIQYLSNPQSAMLDDILARNERGTRGPHEFTLNGKVARGIYVIRLGQPGKSDDTNLVYTPGAPDGIAYRTMEMIRHLFGDSRHPGMVRYFKARFSTADHGREVIGKVFDDLQRNSKVSARPAYGVRLTDRFRLEYDNGIEELTANVDAITESRGEMTGLVVKETWEGIKLAAMIATLPFPPASALMGGVFTAERLCNGIRVYQDGDRSAALEHFTSASWDLAGAAGDLVGGGLKGATQTGAAAHAVRANTMTTVVDSVLHADLPSGTRTIRTDGHMKDVIEISQRGERSRYFVQDGSHYFEVKPDHGNSTLRLVDPRKGGQQMYFEPVVKNESGQWVYHADVSLRGGG